MADNQNNVIRYQINCLFETYHGANVRSDHQILKGTLRIKLIKLIIRKNSDTIQKSQLKTQTIKHEVARKIRDRPTKIGNDDNEDVHGKSETAKDTLMKTCETTLKGSGNWSLSTDIHL